jgi:hypothetical protein
MSTAHGFEHDLVTVEPEFLGLKTAQGTHYAEVLEKLYDQQRQRLEGGAEQWPKSDRDDARVLPQGLAFR